MIPGTNIRSAERLREEFDRTFTLAPPGPPGARRDFVLVLVDSGTGTGNGTGNGTGTGTGTGNGNGPAPNPDRDSSREPDAASDQKPSQTLSIALPGEALRGIERVAAVIRVPSSVPALEGIAGLHGAIVPVFRLPGAPASMGRDWHAAPLIALVEAPDGTLAGLAFNRLEGFVRVAGDQVLSDSGGGLTRQARETLVHQDQFYPVLQTAPLLRSLAAPAGSAAPEHTGPAESM